MMSEFVITDWDEELELRLKKSAALKKVTPEAEAKSILEANLPQFLPKQKPLERGREILKKTANHQHTSGMQLKREIYGE